MSENHSRFRRVCTSFIVAVLSATGGCHDPDPRTVEGALDATARAIEMRDARALYRVIDQRARHALISIVQDRQAAADRIRADYPGPLREAALAELGDAARVLDGPGLFAARCPEACMAEIAGRLGAPVGQTREGPILHVRTTRGTTLDMYPGDDGWYGLVWNTRALSEERDAASQQRAQIEKNAEIYRRQRALDPLIKEPGAPAASAPAPAP